MLVRGGRLRRDVLVQGPRGLGAVLAVAGVLAAPGVAHATVTFDRAFGEGVDTGAAAFQNCTTASTCQAGSASDAAGGMFNAGGVALDAQGRILVAEYDNHRVARFVVAGDGTVSFERAFGVDVDPSDGNTGDFENCTTASTCQAGTGSAVAGDVRFPGGVAVDAQGRILVTDGGNGRVDRFAVAGDGTVSFDRAFGINVDPSDGNTGDFENCTSTCQAGTGSGAAGGISNPFGVAVDAQGRILVADQANRRVSRFAVASDGTVSFDRAFGVNVDPSDGNTGDFENCTTASTCRDGTESTAAGGMEEPRGVAVDAEGRILVTDSEDDPSARVDRFTVAGDGTVSFDRAFGVDVDPSDGNTGDFENCTTASTCRAGTESGAAGGIDDPFGVTVDAEGRILVGDSNSNRVDRFAVAGDGTVSFDRAFGINVDPSDGNSGDFENCTSASTCQAGTQSGVAGGMDFPAGVAVDAQGRILVADQINNRVSRFLPGRTVTVTKALAPATDPGTFDLRVDAAVVRAAASNGQSGSLQVADGVDVTISEQAASGQNPLSNYDTTIDCGAGPQPGTSLTVTNVTANVNCTITNTRKAAPSGPGPGGGSAIDTTLPVFASASLTNRTFAVDTRGAAETAVTARAKKGTSFRYTLSEDARVVFTIERSTTGRRVGSKCRKQTRSNRKRRRCTLFVRAGRFAKQSTAGANRHPFSGRIGRKSLKPGKYRATLTATDAAGNRSTPRRLNFKVVKR
jgi:hypothetical protein